MQRNSTYQALFNVKEDRFEDLANAKTEIERRVQLWLSISDWSQLLLGWQEAPFMTLSAEEINITTAKYQKINNKLDRELSTNPVVPKAKAMVQEMSVTFLIILALKNKDLKPHHWVKMKDTRLTVRERE